MKNSGDYLGHYRLLTCLRQTSQCLFYLAEDINDPGALYTLQLWPAIALQSRDSYIEFLEWVKALVNLRDPALVPVIDGDVVEGHPYLVQGSELVTRSETLTLRLARSSREPLLIAEARQIVEQVGRGLVAAHRLDMLHGQLAPQWVLLTADGRTLLSGLKPPFALPDQDHPRYCPPEGRISKRGDQYALAMLVRDVLASTSHEERSGFNLAALEPATDPDPQRRFASIRAFLRALGYELPFPESPLERWERPAGPAMQGGIDRHKVMASAQGSQHGQDQGQDQPAISEDVPLATIMAPPPPPSPAVSGSSGPVTPITPALPLTPVTPPPLSPAETFPVGAAGLQSGGGHRQNLAFTGSVTTPAAIASRVARQLRTVRLPALMARRRRIALSTALAIILVLLLILGGIWLYGLLPATAASVTIVPVRQQIVQSYTFARAQSDDFANHQVATRVLSYTTPKRSKTLPSSIAHANIPATHARGKLVFSSVSRDIQPDESLVIQASNGLDIAIIDHGLIRSQGSTTVDAIVEQAGSQGNIPAHFLDGFYAYSGSAAHPSFTAYISNPAPFTGGADAYDGPEVTQKDINDAQRDLTEQLQQEVKQHLQTQLHAGEDFLNLGSDVLDCSVQMQADHVAGDHSSRVTVTGQLSCKAVAYDAQALIGWVEQDLQQRVEHSLGAHFGRVGELQTSALLGIVQAPQFLFIASGQWVLQLDAAGRQAVAQSIAGLSQDEARALLLKRFHAKTRSMQLAPLWGKHLPASANAITIIGLSSLPPGS
uniref:Protein kinase domain-containing protein n=1 Tax=Thermogemmatispora argillosa TaxID=2045280 RepID=A0A455T2N0_9CHLR|nr:hypothetical protein KTA_23770 [Thermogemmatispora argillosa]